MYGALVRKSFLVLAILALLAGSLTGAAAGAQSVQLANEREVRGTLQGDPGGAFALYDIAYPGGDAKLEVELWFRPGDALVATAFGFSVYGTDGFQGKGEPNADGLPQLEFSYAAADPGALTVQVYNYNETVNVSYGLTARGIAAAPAASAAPAVPAVAPAAPAAAVETSGPAPFPGTVSGALVGNAGGGISLHAVDYTGDGFDTTVKLTYWPADPSIGDAVGMNIYSPSGALVAVGQPTENAGERAAAFSSNQAGRYVVQVYNYIEGMEVGYTLRQGHWVDIGGRKLHAVIAGQGGPTIVLEAGLGQPYETWAAVSPEIIKMGRTVMYDRAYLGLSDPGPEPRNVGQVAEELHAMLVKAKIAPPYVLVGHSMGGMTIRLFAALWPDEVAGLVFVDGSHEEMNARVNALLTPEEVAQSDAETAAFIATTPKGIQLEFGVWGQNEAMMRNVGFPTNVPVVSLVQSGPIPETAPKVEKLGRTVWLELHADWLKLMPQAKQVLANKSGHFIQFDEPQLVIDAVREVVSAARAK